MFIRKLSGFTKVSASSKKWLERHCKDPYVKMALEEGYRARSAYKLLQMNDKKKFLKPGMTVIECGAAPGAWTQVLAKIVNPDNDNKGLIISCDLLDIKPVKGAVLLPRCDFTHPETQNKMLELLGRRKIDFVLSDMAPNATGLSGLDQERIIELAFKVLRFSVLNSPPGAGFLCKIYPGPSSEYFLSDVGKFYKKVKELKPKSSRPESMEKYVLAEGFKGLAKD